MATSYTQHYGLCQWAPGDQFLREEFNGDNQKIEAALGAVEGRALRAERRLEPLGYDVYQLMLQNDYDGKQTGYRRAVVFDGFADSAQVSSTTAALTVDTAGRRLFLDNRGQSDYEHNFGTNNTTNLERNASHSGDFTATGNGTLTAVEFYLRGTVTCRVYFNGAQLGECVRSTPAEGSPVLTSFPFSIPVQEGKTYLISVQSTGGASATLTYSQRINGQFNLFGFRLRITPSGAERGVMTARTVSLGTGFTRALAWVRHQNGTVDLALNGGSGWRDLPCVSTRPATALTGQSCTERAYALDLSGGPDLQVRLTLNASGYANLTVFDYGVVVM